MYSTASADGIDPAVEASAVTPGALTAAAGPFEQPIPELIKQVHISHTLSLTRSVLFLFRCLNCRTAATLIQDILIQVLSWHSVLVDNHIREIPKHGHVPNSCNSENRQRSI